MSTDASEEKYGVKLYDMAEALLTVIVVISVTCIGFWIYNAITGSLWRTAAQTEKDLKDRGVEQGEDGVWRIKTNKVMTQENYVDKTQRAFVNAAPAMSFTKGKKKSGKTE
ncbi:hypothetical protein FRB96_004031 [Tulasnella sp. 330]|nr:hypothetical protein FRB96_004031 [Tulasnella sp. 330]KAG8886007.1 hypothetical protein FRB97_008545 [Tulasnella sp. 331]KAG8888278.1 hypothetical protein FRB98_008024 [Tulasnella sp. 332]